MDIASRSCVAALALLAAQPALCQTRPTHERADQGVIFFASDRGGDFDLYRMNPDGSNVVQITRGSAEDSSPSLSPDGTRIVFVSNRDGERGLYVMNADGSDSKKIADDAGEGARPTWSPDGRQIACDLKTGRKIDVYVMNADGSGLKKIADDAMMPAWSPDGKTIAFNRGQLPKLGLMDADGRNVRPLLPKDSGANPLPDLGPIWSPDGRLILYTAVTGVEADQTGHQEMTYEVRTVTIDGSQVKPLKKIKGMALCWSPDGRQIVVMSGERDEPDLFTMNADGTDFRQITSHPGKDMWACWGRLAAKASGQSRVNGDGSNEGKFLSLVLLRRQPRTLTAVDVKQAVGRAFPDAVGKCIVVESDRPMHFGVRTPEFDLAVVCIGKPYVRDRGAVADRVSDFRLKAALQDHKAWLAVDLIGDPEPENLESAYRHLSRLIAEFADQDSVALYSVATGQLNTYWPELLPVLRGDNPLTALTLQQPNPPVIPVSPDDPEMTRAVAEAREKWPQFVAAFEKRQPLQAFAVKAQFVEGEHSEFMWVEVKSIDEKAVRGTLANEPRDFQKLKLGDAVEVRVADIQDWIYSDGERMVGGFSVKVLERRGKPGGE
ncbi:MAG: DUF2314 domain-containing protein [Phycisphaerales bacterium]|nr:DUF2314 domain-containing protein [Phycisphaerales bacterium]MCI0631676.1 DUF2314 domain-containing protein [Phycisphaerales bacterium]MCI0677026.1 DUF2314 domain-containing protein [Phycisphaerales bacterium]